MEASARIAGSDGESLTVRLVEVESVQPGSSGPMNVLLRVGFEFRTFSSEVEVWIEAGEWQQFRLGMVRIERDRDGSVSLRSMSPGELDLTLTVAKGGRTIVLDGLLGHRRGHHSVGLTFSKVDIDVGLLSAFLHDMERLAE